MNIRSHSKIERLRKEFRSMQNGPINSAIHRVRRKRISDKFGIEIPISASSMEIVFLEGSEPVDDKRALIHFPEENGPTLDYIDAQISTALGGKYRYLEFEGGKNTSGVIHLDGLGQFRDDDRILRFNLRRWNFESPVHLHTLGKPFVWFRKRGDLLGGSYRELVEVLQ